MKIRLGLLAIVCGCSAITDFDPNKLGSGDTSGSGGMSGSGGSSGNGGSSGSGGMSGSGGGMAGNGGTGGQFHDAAVPDAAVDAPGPMCFQNTDCTDNNFCTLNICMNGQCVFPARNCDDNRTCTTDGCNPSFGCTHTPNNDACNDNIDCTVDTCDTNGPTPTGCVHTPDNSLCPPSPFTCVDTFCDPVRGCVQQPNNANCNDNDPCTMDSCSPNTGGTGGDGCVHTPIPNCTPCSSNGDCPSVCVPCSTPLTQRKCQRACGPNGVCVLGQCDPTSQCSVTCTP